MPVNPEEITWYQCGPTVYDESHMGHARTYVSFDIIRRIMADYFGYNINVSFKSHQFKHFSTYCRVFNLSSDGNEHHRR